eukprot:gene14659-67324_t
MARTFDATAEGRQFVATGSTMGDPLRLPTHTLDARTPPYMCGRRFRKLSASTR